MIKNNLNPNINLDRSMIFLEMNEINFDYVKKYLELGNKLENFKKWVNLDIKDVDIRDKLNLMIDEDYSKSSPKILEGIEGKYSPYKKHLSTLGQTQANIIKMDTKLAQTLYVSLAAAKFKSKLKSRLGNDLDNTK